jgi:hypothetical protein
MPRSFLGHLRPKCCKVAGNQVRNRYHSIRVSKRVNWSVGTMPLTKLLSTLTLALTNGFHPGSPQANIGISRDKPGSTRGHWPGGANKGLLLSRSKTIEDNETRHVHYPYRSLPNFSIGQYPKTALP